MQQQARSTWEIRGEFHRSRWINVLGKGRYRHQSHAMSSLGFFASYRLLNSGPTHSIQLPGAPHLESLRSLEHLHTSNECRRPPSSHLTASLNSVFVK